jgi:hypothetical protein
MKYAYSYRANLTEESISVHPRRTLGPLREAIDAVIEALADGKIDPEELRPDPKTNTQHIRYVSCRLDGSIIPAPHLGPRVQPRSKCAARGHRRHGRGPGGWQDQAGGNAS